MTTILFATSRVDAENYCNENDLVFEDVVWVLNPQLLGEMSTEGADVHYTETFKLMPVYGEAVARVAPVVEAESHE
jgi:hypothetical protein